MPQQSPAQQTEKAARKGDYNLKHTKKSASESGKEKV